MPKLKEKKGPSRTSDEDASGKKTKVEGKEGLERLAEFTRRILKSGKVTKQTG